MRASRSPSWRSRALELSLASVLLLAPRAASAQLQQAGDGPRASEPFCVGVTGQGCRTTLAIELGLGVGPALHDGVVDVAARGHLSLGLRARAARSWRVGPMVDLGFEVSGNEDRDKAVGWYVVPKISALRVLDEDWALALGAGPSFARTSHDRGTDSRLGAFVEGGGAFGEVSATVAVEPLFAPSGERDPELRTYVFLRASGCGWLWALSYGAIEC